jgi:hypothetical protein
MLASFGWRLQQGATIHNMQCMKGSTTQQTRLYAHNLMQNAAPAARHKLLQVWASFV